jgi:hypothetical protein
MIIRARVTRILVNQSVGKLKENLQLETLEFTQEVKSSCLSFILRLDLKIILKSKVVWSTGDLT